MSRIDQRLAESPAEAVPPPVPAPPRRAPRPRRPATGRKTLGQILLDQGAIRPADLVRALALQGREAANLGDILLHQGLVTETALARGLAEHYGAPVLDGAADPPDPRLIDRFGAEDCLRLGVLPWRQAGGVTLVAVANPEAWPGLRPVLEACLGPVAMGVVAPRDLQAVLVAMRGKALDARAQARLSDELSCRRWHGERLRHAAIAAGAVALALAVAAPGLAAALLLGWIAFWLLAATALKTAAFAAHLARRDRTAPEATRPGEAPRILRLPVVSVMVPLYREGDIAQRLVARLGALSYPRELLDIMLVVEEADSVTRDALARADLPRWMRVITVPDAPLRTKPRALNFALAFAQGSIVGVWDAEDAPEAGQIHRVVRRFHERGAEVACLQGMLDYYNPRTNWLSRCFTIEYAAWFRILLPGMERLGLAVPLGGTTLFFRREALERLGGWDAHNVTEDADLGIRLARMGYRTELIETVTHEEANCRVVPWVKQRSRWLKGYAMTWAVHMRDPARLWRDLGPWRFVGFQVLFLGTLTQFVLAPVLWSFWLYFFGLPHPLAEALPRPVLVGLAVLFLATEVVNASLMIVAVSGRRHRFLRLWVPLMHAYFPLASLAAYKGLWELAVRPFYWDKTVHGIFDGPGLPAAAPRRVGA